MKKVGVLFSGGLDSTYLIWKNLNEGNYVIPLYIEIENNPNKTILEKNRIGLLYKEFDNLFPNKIESPEVILSINIFSDNSTLIFKQLPIWILGLIYKHNFLKIDEYQIGYIGNDDILGYIDDVVKIYESYRNVLENNQIPLIFPLKKQYKEIIVKELPKNILKLVVSCENPILQNNNENGCLTYEPCGECDSCCRIIQTNYYKLNKFPVEYKNTVERYYSNKIKEIKHFFDENNSLKENKTLDAIQLSLNF